MTSSLARPRQHEIGEHLRLLDTPDLERTGEPPDDSEAPSTATHPCPLVSRSGSACDDDTVRALGNVIWFVLAGFWLWLVYVLAGILACILIITIPFGIAAFRIAGFVVWPFGRTTVAKPTAGVGSLIGNVIWLILLGWELALAHLVTAFLLALTIIGIPLAVANVKLIPISLWPLGREVVSIEVAQMRGIVVTTPQPLGRG